MADLLTSLSIRDVIASFSQSVEQKTGRPFDEFKWPSKLIYFHLINNRADVYYQTRKLNLKDGNFEDYSNILPCVEMLKADMVECPCAPKSGCFWMKSKYPLPTFMTGRPDRVTTLTGLKKYNYVDWSRFRSRISSRITASNKGLLYTIKDNGEKAHLYTYITNEIEAQMVQISGIPIDPVEFKMFPVCGEDEEDCMCDILDLKFDIEKRLMNQLFELTFQTLIRRNGATRIGDMLNDDRNPETAPDPRF